MLAILLLFFFYPAGNLSNSSSDSYLTSHETAVTDYSSVDVDAYY